MTPGHRPASIYERTGSHGPTAFDSGTKEEFMRARSSDTKLRGRLVKLESVEIESTGLLRRSEQACIMHAKPGCHREGSYLASYAASEFGRLRPSLHHHHLHKCGSN